MTARIFLLLLLAAGLVLGQAMPVQDCVQRSCVCCAGTTACCAVSEAPSLPSAVPVAQETSLDLKVSLMPLVELVVVEWSAVPRVVSFAPAKPACLASSARIELTCVRLI